MKKIFLLVLILFLGCDKSCPPIDHKISSKEKSADAVLKKVASYLRNKFGLIPIGTGGGMMYQIRMLALSFEYRKPISIEEGRRLLLGSMDVFVDAVNNDLVIREYLLCYPFDSKRIEIRIFIRDFEKDNGLPEMGEICVISCVRGLLEYYIRDPETSRLKCVYSESIEDAKDSYRAFQKSGNEVP